MNETDQQFTNITVETKLGTLKNVQPQYLGWLILGGILVYLLWFITTGMSANLESMNKNITAQTTILERILDHVKLGNLGR